MNDRVPPLGETSMDVFETSVRPSSATTEHTFTSKTHPGLHVLCVVPREDDSVNLLHPWRGDASSRGPMARSRGACEKQSREKSERPWAEERIRGAGPPVPLLGPYAEIWCGALGPDSLCRDEAVALADLKPKE